MSLTFPTVYSDGLKKKNIQEDWLIQLGYDEAFDAATSLLAEALDASETAWDVDDGTEFTAGDLIKVDSEIAKVSSIASDTLTVIRGVEGTTATEHDDNTQIYFYNYLGISRKNYLLSDRQFYGIIEDLGEIEEILDLVNSKASISGVSVGCLNKLKSGTLSEVLFGGSNKFLNREVRIYSSLGNESIITNCALLFRGILANVNHTYKTALLEIEQKEPWDKIKIPQTKTTYKGIYEPVAYGNFSENSDNDFPTNTALYPVPRLKRVASKMWYILSHAETGSAELHYYDEGLECFHVLTTTDSNSTSANGVNQSSVDIGFERSCSFRANATEATDEFTDSENSYDGDTGTYAIKQNTSPTTGLDEEYRLKVEIPEPDMGRFTALEIHANIDIVIDSFTNPTPVTGSDRITAKLLAYWASGEELSVASEIADAADDGVGTVSNSDFNESYLSEYEGVGNYKLPDYIGVRGQWNSEATYSITGSVRVKDIWIEGTLEIDFDSGDAGSVEAGNKVIKDIDVLYVGADGLDESFTGGSGSAASLPHEIHRDLLKRFTDLDYADAQMSGYTTLDTERAGWDCRWWIDPEDPQVELREILEQIQYEGCFIFIQSGDADGSQNAGGKYIYIKDSYTSGDVEATLTEKDYTGEPEISLTPIKDIVTYREYNYKKHPTGGFYIENVSYTNSTQRTNYNIGTNENKEFIDLDFMVADQVYNGEPGDHDPNDCIALYYNNINGSPKIFTAVEIINPVLWNLERGDIIQFNDSRIDPYGLAWSDLYFMIIEKRRSLKKMYILTREVYQS